MKRSTALLAATFLDLFAVAIFYFNVYQPLNEVFAGIAVQAEAIKYDTNLFLGFAGVILPVIHIIGLIETYLPRYFNRSICTKVIYGALIISLLAGIVTGKWVKQQILNSGYFHCQGADVHRRLLRIDVYTLVDDTCRELTIERKSHRRLGDP